MSTNALRRTDSLHRAAGLRKHAGQHRQTANIFPYFNENKYINLRGMAKEASC